MAGDHAYDRLPTTRSRELRNNATPAERKLWSVLSNRQLGGVRFNRQVVIRPYICDLVARSAKLVVEIDGGQHGNSIGYDKARTAFLKAKGYRVIRFWNNDVLGNIEGVVATISQALKLSPPTRVGGWAGRHAPGMASDGRGPSEPAHDSPKASGGGHVVCEDDRPSPSSLRSSSPPAPAGGVK